MIKLPYVNLTSGLTEKEYEVQLKLEGGVISLFVPHDKVDTEKQFVLVFEIGRKGDVVLIELPGEPLNTSRRVTVNKRWLEGAAIR